MEGSVKPDIFKAYDIRGEVGTELTTDVAWAVGAALADWLPDQVRPVAVGYDMRPDSQSLAEAMIEGLRMQGRKVINIGNVSSDMIYFAVGKLELAGGAMVTASHNPGNYNGIKLCREEARPIGVDSGLTEIRDMAMTASFSPAAQKGDLEEKDVREEWVSHVLSFVNAKKWPNYHIAIDAGNGMLGAIAPVFQARVPQLSVEEMYYELDGTFPNHIANPIEPENLIDIQQKIREQQLDFGIAFDGDGDRAVLLDERGEAVSGTVMTAVLARYFLRKKPGSTILYNAIVGRIVPEVVNQLDGVSVRTKVGHSYIKALMREHNAIFAGEHSSHYYFRDNWSADSGLLASVIAIQVLAESGLSLSKLVEEFKTNASLTETNFVVDDKQAVIEAIRQAFADGTQDDLDGLTVNYDDAWFNIRASNTEPVLRLNGEAKTQQRLDELITRVTELVTSSSPRV